MNKFDTLFNMFMEEVSTFLDSENKIKNNDEESDTEATSNDNNQDITAECCEGGAGIDVR